MATWKPYTMQEMENLLEEEQADFSPDEHAKFARTKVPIRKVRCIRSIQYPDDAVFLVASDGETAVVFDDVDEEFSICKANAIGDGVVREWTLIGGLSHALMRLK
jgi:hypothetical protein